jgi:hypothetical protein
MLVLQYTFTRPNTSVSFYSPAGNSALTLAIIDAKASGDIISFTDSTSSNGLVMTRTINLPSEAALARINSNAVISSNKQARTAYNNANGITETTAQGTV